MSNVGNAHLPVSSSADRGRNPYTASAVQSLPTGEYAKFRAGVTLQRIDSAQRYFWECPHLHSDAVGAARCGSAELASQMGNSKSGGLFWLIAQYRIFGMRVQDGTEYWDNIALM